MAQFQWSLVLAAERRLAAEQLGGPHHLALVFDLALCSIAAAGANPCDSKPPATNRIRAGPQPGPQRPILGKLRLTAVQVGEE